MSSSFDTFYKTFSGTDTLVFILIPNTKPIVLGSLSTISYSTFRIKKPVPLISEINVSGYTKGIRTVAGTMVFTLINQHWVNELIDAIPCLKQFENLKPDELPLFDLLIVSANEYGSSISGQIHGVDITDDAGVISVQDMYLENTISFLARDIDLLKSDSSTNETENKSKLNYKYTTVNNYSLSTFNSENAILSKTTIEAKKELYETNRNVICNDIFIDMSNFDFEKILYEFDNVYEVSLYAKSYYGSDKNVYVNNIKSNKVVVKDISSAFVYNSNSNSYPSSIDLIIKASDKLIKINITIKM